MEAMRMTKVMKMVVKMRKGRGWLVCEEESDDRVLTQHSLEGKGEERITLN